ncbi:hypothetical protein CRUP_005663 [Coryphaenoides rupestris]|nr:hypothetical protein CRUP_005663 [Coryphaenoides rupestris]
MKFLALSCLTLFGYFGDVYCGTVGMNSNSNNNNNNNNNNKNAIKTLEPVSPSPPRTAASESLVHKLPPVDTLQPGVCAEDEECGADEFCSDARGACLPCRRTRKRCGRDAMCCTGSRCSNAVRTDTTTTAWPTTPRDPRLPTAVLEAVPEVVLVARPTRLKVRRETPVCARPDCSEGFCCARHFWSRICKPVLSEGQVCTRHRRKGAHGLELFQRCDCGDGLACRPERGAAPTSTRPPPNPPTHHPGRTACRGREVDTPRREEGDPVPPTRRIPEESEVAGRRRGKRER